MTLLSNQMSIDINTELQIKEKAKMLFFQEGYLNATVQEIADYAGVKRTSVNYYFRNKENLFSIVYLELINEMRQALDNIYKATLSFEEKVDQLIDFFFQHRLQFPYLEVFNIQESNTFKHNLANTSLIDPMPLEHLDVFLAEIELAMKNGIIKQYHPVNFLMNIISMISFPIIMKPIFKRIYTLDDVEYSELLLERKAIIKQTLFN